jgi:hypothetical protein
MKEGRLATCGIPCTSELSRSLAHALAGASLLPVTRLQGNRKSKALSLGWELITLHINQVYNDAIPSTDVAAKQVSHAQNSDPAHRSQLPEQPPLSLDSPIAIHIPYLHISHTIMLKKILARFMRLPHHYYDQS